MKARSGSLIVAAFLAAPALAQQPSSYSGHGAASISRDTILKYAAPPLDPEVSRRIQMMLDVRAPGLGTVSPDGKRLFFSWNITGTPAVWRLEGPMSFPVQMTGGEDPTRLSGMTPDGRWLVLSRDRGGQEDPGLYLQSVDGGALRLVQHTPGTRAMFAFATSDSKWLYFLANDRKPDSYAVYRFDIAAGKRELVFSDDGLWSIADYREGAAEPTLLLQKATGALSSEFYEWAGGKLRPLIGQGEAIEYEAAYAAGAGELLVQTNKFGEFRRLYRWKDGQYTPVSPEMPMDVSGFSVDLARRHVYYTVNDGGYTRMKVLDGGTLEPVAFPDVGKADHVFAGFPTRDGRFVTIGVDTGRAPRASYVFDWQTKKLTQWMLPSAPEVSVEAFAVPRLESYPARDGTKVPMFVRYPRGCAPEDRPQGDPCPVVVEFHGGPEGQSQPGFSPWAQLFIDAGFVFVQPNVRGSDGYGKSWLEADNGPRRLDVVTDIQDCGQFIKKEWARNGKVPQVAIIGGSYGGYSTLVGMTMFAGTYDAGVSIVGISDLTTFLKNTAPYRRLLRITEYGDPEKDAEALRKLSPTTYIDRVQAPLLIIQGVDDPRVPAGEAVQIHEALYAKGVPVELILLEGEGHGAARRGGQVIQAGHTIRFLEEHLLGKRTSAAVREGP